MIDPHWVLAALGTTAVVEWCRSEYCIQRETERLLHRARAAEAKLTVAEAAEDTAKARHRQANTAMLEIGRDLRRAETVIRLQDLTIAALTDDKTALTQRVCFLQDAMTKTADGFAACARERNALTARLAPFIRVKGPRGRFVSAG